MSRGPDRRTPQPPPRPTREQFLGNERARQIREVCIEILKATDSLVEDPKVFHDAKLQQQLYANLEALNGKLIALGIKKGMHVGHKPEKDFADPAFMAEYVAGQLWELTGREIVSMGKALPQIKEFSEEKVGEEGGPQAYVLPKPANLPQSVKDFMFMRSMVNVGISFLDADEDMKEHWKQQEDE